MIRRRLSLLRITALKSFGVAVKAILLGRHPMSASIRLPIRHISMVRRKRKCMKRPYMPDLSMKLPMARLLSCLHPSIRVR